MYETQILTRIYSRKKRQRNKGKSKKREIDRERETERKREKERHRQTDWLTEAKYKKTKQNVEISRIFVHQSVCTIFLSWHCLHLLICSSHFHRVVVVQKKLLLYLVLASILECQRLYAIAPKIIIPYIYHVLVQASKLERQNKLLPFLRFFSLLVYLTKKNQNLL